MTRACRAGADKAIGERLRWLGREEARVGVREPVDLRVHRGEHIRVAVAEARHGGATQHPSEHRSPVEMQFRHQSRFPPYRKPALRYLYTVGWVSAASDLNSCKAAQLLGPDPAVAAAQALRGSPKTLALLRAAHLTVGQAATAIARGTTDGCA